MTVCVNNQYRLATWDHDLEGAGSLTDEHRKKIIHGDSDWICAHFQRDPQSRIWLDQKRKLNVNCNQIWKAVFIIIIILKISKIKEYYWKTNETGWWDLCIHCKHQMQYITLLSMLLLRSHWKESNQRWLACIDQSCQIPACCVLDRGNPPRQLRQFQHHWGQSD